MPAADSNVLLRLLVRDDDAQQHAASAFFRGAGSVFVSHVVLAEVVWALTFTYGFPKPRVIAVVERLPELDGLALEDPAVVARALDDYRGSTADFSDCLILELARRANQLPLATFDLKLGRLEGVRRLGSRRRRS